MHVVLLSIPGLRERDVASMPNLDALARDGERAALTPSFPAVTCPVQANMTTGCLPREHGVVANGFYWRERGEVEMWTAWNDCITRPQLWDLLHERNPSLTSAVWFPLHSKGCGADYICTPAPVHNPDGSESLWCYTRPEPMYGELRDALGHFPLKHFWGPLAGIQSTAWIVASAVWAAARYRPNLFYVYLPHLDYAAQKHGPDSPQANASLTELDAEIGKLVAGVEAAYSERPLWIVASEYAIVPVSHVTYPNRVLREAGLLAIRDEDGRELLDVANSPAWALVDHQFSHVFVRDRDSSTIKKVADLFRNQEGIAEVLVGEERAKYALDHERSGDVVLISTPDSWQAYYWWLDDERAPAFAHTVDIHRKPGYDPVELFFDPVKKGIPLDATLVKGSHGAPVQRDGPRGVVVSSRKGILDTEQLADTEVADVVLRQF
ncbi:MAG: nucleotide pyrophosphatase/phosphodiesterase family protein [Pirellulales bacterium]